MTTIRDPDPLQPAVNELFWLLRVAAQSPGTITPESLGEWLHMAAFEQHQQGNQASSEMLDALAIEAEGKD